MAFAQLARAELQASFRLAPTLVSLAPAPSALPPPVPVPRPRLAVVLPPHPPPPKPVTHDRIAWIPQPKPERQPPPERIAWIPQLKPEWRPAPEPPAGPRIAIWPPPWKPAPADLRLAVAPAAGPPENLRSAIWPPPRKPAPPDPPLAVAHAAGLPEHPPRPDGPVPVVVAHGRAERPAVDDGIAVSEFDQLLPQLDRAAREALLADDPATLAAAQPRKAAGDTPLFSNRAERLIEAARLGHGTTPGSDAARRVVPAPAATPPGIIHLSVIVYHAPDDWRVWLNGRSYTPAARPRAIEILEVTADAVRLTWRGGAHQRPRQVELQPNQSYLIASGEIIEGRPRHRLPASPASPPARGPGR